MPPTLTKPVTLRDVARAAGVSIASASRALSRDDAVSADLRRRIQAAAARLGYTPNLAARKLAGRRSGLVGVVADNLADPLIGLAVASLERRLAAAGYGVMIAAAQGSVEESLAALGRLLGHGAEALVLAEPPHARELAAALHARAIPWVAIGEATGGPAAVAIGRRRGAALAVRYLVELGHRRIAVLAAAADGIAAGVAEALADGNLRSSHDTLLQPTPHPEAAQSALRLLLGRRDAPTAVVCGSDLLALAALRECMGNGIAVPRQLSIVGFGDAEFARRASPALTTVRVPAAELGVLLAESLLSSLHHGEAREPVFEMPVKLVVRESTAAVSMEAAAASSG